MIAINRTVRKDDRPVFAMIMHKIHTIGVPIKIFSNNYLSQSDMYSFNVVLLKPYSCSMLKMIYISNGVSRTWFTNCSILKNIIAVRISVGVMNRDRSFYDK